MLIEEFDFAQSYVPLSLFRSAYAERVLMQIYDELIELAKICLRQSRIARTTEEARGIKIEAIYRALYHAFCGQDLVMSLRPHVSRSW